MNQMIPTTPRVGARSGDWVWDGSRWVCDPDCDLDPCPQPPVVTPVTPAFFGPPVFSGPTTQPPWYPGANGGVSFGQVGNFPPNPTRGHMFFDGKTLWLFDGAEWVGVGAAGTTGDGSGGGSATGAGTVVISATAPGNPATGSQWWDGSVLRMWNGSSWVVIGPGQAAGPVPTTTIAFTMTVTSDKSIGASWTVVPFTDTPQVDTMQAYDAITHRYKPTKAGMYQFQIRGFPGGGIACVKNDTGNFQGSVGSDIIVAIATEQTQEWMQSAGISLMNGSTDFVRMWARSPGGTFPNATANPVFTAIQLP